MTLVPERYFRARAVQHEGAWAQFGRASTGTQQLLILFEIVEDGESCGQRLPWFGFFTDGAWERTIESLRYCGFEGDDLARLNDQQLDREVSIKVEHEHNSRSGRTYARVAFVNAGGAVKLADPMTADELHSFAAMMTGKLVGSTSRSSSGGCARRAADPIDALGYAPPPSDDDLPF